MCVILVCPEGVRPTPATIAACHEVNPHGIGVAWRFNGQVRWLKGLEPEGLERVLALVRGEVIIHFRWASVGPVIPHLCHPFPITARATTRLSGRARAVLFHNGTWPQWRETLESMPSSHQPQGRLSDTRVAASLVDLSGVDVLERLPGRYVFFDRDFTELMGDWRKWRGMQVSNLHFLSCLGRQPATAESWHQPSLPFSGKRGTRNT
jgi:hypothetical protein